MLGPATPRLRRPLHAFYDPFTEAVAAALRARGLDAPTAHARARVAVALLEGLALFRAGLCGERDPAVDAEARAALRALLGRGVIAPRPARP